MKRFATVLAVVSLLALPLVSEAKTAAKHPPKHAKKVVVCEPVTYTAPCFNPLAPVAAVFHGTAMFVGAVGDGIAGIFACPAR